MQVSKEDEDSFDTELFLLLPIQYHWCCAPDNFPSVCWGLMGAAYVIGRRCLLCSYNDPLVVAREDRYPNIEL